MKEKYLFMKWKTIREMLSNIIVSTTSMNTKEGRKIHIRNTSRLESLHKEIFEALKLSQSIIPPRKSIL